MTNPYAVAPVPPAGPGDQPADHAIDHFLSELGRWRLRREHELRALDEITRTHDERHELNGDVTTSMTLWHAVAQRHDLLMATWEDAKAGEAERDWVAQLIWGVLEMPDGDAEALAIPLPDAMRLSDALASSLRMRTGSDGDGATVRARAQDLGSEVDRLRSQLADRGGALGRALDEVESQLADLELDGEGSAGATGTLQARLAQIDHAAIVDAAATAHGHADADQAQAERQHLIAKGEGVRSLAQRVLNTVHPAPTLGIPDVTALGEVPTSDEHGELTTYIANLARVGRALDQAHSTYAASLASYADLADRAERLAKTLAGCGAPTSVDLAGMLTATKESLHNQPADIHRAAALIAAQEAYLGQLRPDA